MFRHGRVSGSIGQLGHAEISRAVKWISVKLCTDCRVSQRMNLSLFSDRLTFPVMAPAVQNAWIVSRYQKKLMTS